MITEADTCRKYVLPKLYASGWNDEQISEQKSFRMAESWRWEKKAAIDEAEGKFLRVILLPGGETVHNAFFDRSFTP